MAWTKDATATTVAGGVFESLTISITVDASADLLVVRTACWDATADVQIPTGVTANGQAMTLDAGASIIQASELGVSLWYLSDPPTGTYDVVASWSEFVSRGLAAAESWIGGGTGATLTDANGATAATSVAVTSVADDVVLSIGCEKNNSETDLSPGTGETETWEEFHATGNPSIRAAGAFEIASGTSTTMEYDLTGSTRNVMVAASFAEGGGGGGDPLGESRVKTTKLNDIAA